MNVAVARGGVTVPNESGKTIRLGMAIMGSLWLLLLAFACQGEPESRFYGTWPSPAGKYSFSNKGIALYYPTIESKEPSLEGRFVVEKTWNDTEGNTWLNIKTDWGKAGQATTWFATVKINRDGKTSEQDASKLAYPDLSKTEIGTGFHQVYRRP